MIIILISAAETNLKPTNKPIPMMHNSINPLTVQYKLI